MKSSLASFDEQHIGIDSDFLELRCNVVYGDIRRRSNLWRRNEVAGILMVHSNQVSASAGGL